MYLNPNTLSNQSHYSPDVILLTDEQEAMYIQYNGFVTVTESTNEDGETTYTVAPDIEAWEAWKASLPEPEPAPSPYIPTPEQSSVVMMRAVFAQQVSTMDDDVVIQCSGLAEKWKPGDHKSGEVYNAGDQTWECYQAYDNATYPDIVPDNPAWYTFNRPLHGKSPDTARPFVPVQGSHDMYRAGEYMVWEDGTTQECLKDTAYSPINQPDAWKVYSGE